LTVHKNASLLQRKEANMEEFFRSLIRITGAATAAEAIYILRKLSGLAK
jgi:hypothetical protein